VASKRRRYSAQERRELWERWRGASGQRDRAGARSGTGQSIVCSAKRGGLPPPERRRSRLALTLAEREEISRAIAPARRRGRSPPASRSPSTVTRELGRHVDEAATGAEAELRAWEAWRAAQALQARGPIRAGALVAAKLGRAVVSGADRRWLRRAFPEDETMRVSHETIYLTCSSRPAAP